MTTTGIGTRPDAPAQCTGFATRPVLLIAAAAALVLLVASNSAGYFFDELYFLAAGRDHLAWGYFDQPPLVPVLAALMDMIAPGSLVVFRLPVTIAATATVVLAAAIARELGGSRRAQVLAAGAVAVSGTMIASHWLATYTIDPALWTLILWLVTRWVRMRRDGLLLLAGVVTAVSLQAKFLVPGLWVALIAAVLLVGPRALPRRPALWAGGAIAVVLTVPTLLWQAANGWPYTQMSDVVRAEWEGAVGFASSALILPGLIGGPLMIIGLVRVLRAPRRHPAGYLAIALLGLALAIGLIHGRSYYLLGITPALTALGAVELTAWARGRAPRIRAVLAAVGFALSAAGVLTTLPVLPAPLLPYLPASALVAGETAMQPAGEITAAAFRALPPQQQARTAVVAHIYPIAASIDVYGRRAGAPPAYSPHRGYGYFAPPPETATDALWVGVEEPARLRPYFTECHPLPGDTLDVWLCTGRTVPWAQAWPELRFR
ncbi:glycosyltransferase family 39 protein [Pseudonocardia sp. TRM90224]|uniref:glycosyltransferase family 39 protein n=1 Tax=Pseudonocardia sp. TRM90224 TaxID=2812678 RepID=UPI001E5DE747|nr:glycosyltransferase family 39 protein [Pseudonocardia sp. TRM90224]